MIDSRHVEDSLVHDGPSVNRRQFLAMLVASGVGVPIVASACGGGTAAQTSPSLPSGGASTASRLKLPAFIPIQGVKPDLPATEAGMQAGYLTYPKDLVKSVTQTPG